MDVYIVNTERYHTRRYQIMTKTGTLFEHVFPGKLFSLDKAIQLCGENGHTIKAIGNLWYCLDK